MKNVHQWFDEYAESHQNSTNRTIHWIAIPLIMFSTLGLFWAASDGLRSALGLTLPEYINLATLLLIVGMIWYLVMSVRLFVAMVPVVVLMIYGLWAIRSSNVAPLWAICAAIWIGAWIAQFIGHKIEGKKPSFFKDIQFLLVGPFWLMGKLFKKVGLSY
ncbi:MAG: DUF962 domain-containing protein [Leptospirales bacterium]|nr:DUF962 domain-containing protein [Leptospirales bacterium]